MGEKKTIGKISERFMWNGIIKDVKELVSKISCMKHSSISVQGSSVNLYISYIYLLYIERGSEGRLGNVYINLIDVVSGFVLAEA